MPESEGVRVAEKKKKKKYFHFLSLEIKPFSLFSSVFGVDKKEGPPMKRLETA